MNFSQNSQETKKLQHILIASKKGFVELLLIIVHCVQHGFNCYLIA